MIEGHFSFKRSASLAMGLGEQNTCLEKINDRLVIYFPAGFLVHLTHPCIRLHSVNQDMVPEVRKTVQSLS